MDLKFGLLRGHSVLRYLGSDTDPHSLEVGQILSLYAKNQNVRTFPKNHLVGSC